MPASVGCGGHRTAGVGEHRGVDGRGGQRRPRGDGGRRGKRRRRALREQLLAHEEDRRGRQRRRQQAARAPHARLPIAFAAAGQPGADRAEDAIAQVGVHLHALQCLRGRLLRAVDRIVARNVRPRSGGGAREAPRTTRRAAAESTANRPWRASRSSRPGSDARSLRAPPGCRAARPRRTRSPASEPLVERQLHRALHQRRRLDARQRVKEAALRGRIGLGPRAASQSFETRSSALRAAAVTTTSSRFGSRFAPAPPIDVLGSARRVGDGAGHARQQHARAQQRRAAQPGLVVLGRAAAGAHPAAACPPNSSAMNAPKSPDPRRRRGDARSPTDA